MPFEAPFCVGNTRADARRAVKVDFVVRELGVEGELLRDAIEELVTGAAHVVEALERLAGREASTVLPGYTHMQQAMPSSVALWAGGFAAEIRDDAEGLRQVRRRVGKSPPGSAAGYGTPGLLLDRGAGDLRQTAIRVSARGGGS